MIKTLINKRYLVRLVIETQSPMAINTGDRETAFDTQLARDNNGLPTIPATGIAGVWASVAEALDIFGSDHARATWFGTMQQRSALKISNGLLHDSQNKPVVGIKTQQDLQKDPLLSFLLQERPHHRERVALNDRGVAKDTAKFDQILLPKGCRFSINVQFDDQFVDESEFEALLVCWQSRAFAFGASTRNGLGLIKIAASELLCFDLSKGPAEGHALQKALNTISVPTENIKLPSNKQHLIAMSLPLKALDNWRCGAGSELLGSKVTEHNVNIMSYSEPVIVWAGSKALVEEKKAVLCGSSVKGILAHRVAFHFRKLTQQWAETIADEDHETWESRPEQLSELFGFADVDHDKSVAGKLVVDDCELIYEHTVIRTHNSIDRFTGGTRNGALYSEELLYQPEFTLKLWLDNRAGISETLIQALADTLDDLKLGLLPVGAGSGRGTSLVMQNKKGVWVDGLSDLAKEVKA
ncbi:RAMP superfamily CRISPR-associated protein [uncultured Psychromonas sp.]|uniref:RAMP superfamily CRISPR-associated protein n=1 Tax=uncultured Psychromonas sp. TaxID=173974 RepID=UPI002635AAF0|nr:RAMP superfamily CRISPR-associated protein [uncultured Psychromonas sp.]